MKQKIKSEYWQMIRGICMLAVIIGHCLQGAYGTGFYATVVGRTSINFTVSVFVFMSGYFTKTEKVWEHGYRKQRLKRLLIPYLLWNILYTVKNMVLADEMNLRRWIIDFIVGKASAPLYYILVLVQLTLLTPCIIKIRQKKIWGKLLYLLTPLYLVFVYGYNMTLGKRPYLYETLFPAWFLFYLLGMDCRKGTFDKIISKIHFWWVIMGWLLSFLESLVLLKMGCNPGFVCSQIKYGNFLYSMLLIAWLKKKESCMDCNLLSRIGDCSFGMYFIHMMVLQVVQKMTEMFSLNKMWILNWGISFLFTTIISYCLVAFTRKVSQNQKLLRGIGFD